MPQVGQTGQFLGSLLPLCFPTWLFPISCWWLIQLWPNHAKLQVKYGGQVSHSSSQASYQTELLYSCSAHPSALHGCSQPYCMFSNVPYSHQKMSGGPERYASLPKDTQQVKGRMETKPSGHGLFPLWIHSASLGPSQLAILCLT